MSKRTFAGAGIRAWRTGFAAVFLLACTTGSTSAEPAKPLTLNDALSRALAADFAVPAARARIRGAEAGVRQAGRTLNPSIGVDVENVGGSGTYRGFNRPETTVYLQQTIEMGNKRAARTDVARSELDTTRVRGAARVLDSLREVELAWVDVLAATAQLRIAEDRLAIAQQLRTEIARRVEAGRDPQFTLTRAEAQIALEQIAVDQAKANARIARANLAGYWRGNSNYEIDLGIFESAAISPDGRAYNVDIAVLEAEQRTAGARIGLERSRAIPDPSVRIGVRHFNETRDSAVIGGLSIPIPLFDNNKGNIERAEAERQAAELDVMAARKALRRELTRLNSRLVANAAEAQRIQTEVVPQAERAVQLIRDGLERGAFNYIEFVDAQRVLNDARLRRIESLRAFHQDNATVARLVGRHTRLNIKR